MALVSQHIKSPSSINYDLPPADSTTKLMEISDPVRSETRELVLTNKYNLRQEIEAPNCAKSNVSQDESMSSPDKIS